jgi:hypothetical protein
MLILVVACAALAGGLLVSSRMRDRRATDGKREKRQQRRETLVRALEGGVGGRALVRTIGDGEGRCALGVGDQGTLFVLDASGGSAGSLRTIAREQIVGVEVVEHVWPVQSKTETEVRVGAVDLKVFVADLDRPTLVVAVLDGDARWDGKDHKAARELAYAWEGTLRLLARTDVPLVTAQAAPVAQPAASNVVGADREPTPAERQRARELANRYLASRGRAPDELAARQSRSTADPVR